MYPDDVCLNFKSTKESLDQVTDNTVYVMVDFCKSLNLNKTQDLPVYYSNIMPIQTPVKFLGLKVI
jgi:hypothetical protein